PTVRGIGPRLPGFEQAAWRPPLRHSMDRLPAHRSNQWSPERKLVECSGRQSLRKERKQRESQYDALDLQEGRHLGSRSKPARLQREGCSEDLLFIIDRYNPASA